MNAPPGTSTNGTNGVILRTTVPDSSHLDFSWPLLLLALLVLVLIASGLRKVFWDKDSN
jgi:hypothetical protein